MWKLGSGVIDREPAVVATMPSLPGLPLLRDAIARRATVEFVYRDVDRTVEPYGLLLRDGFWYLVGFDHTRGDRRTFRVDRIDGQITMGDGDQFERPAGLNLRTLLPDDPKMLGPDGDTTEAIVRVDAVRAPAVVRELGADRLVDTNPNGDVDVRVPCANREAFRSWVLGLMEHAEVRSPPDVRADIVEWLERQAAG
jgi:predicted DNA-binding transcriptional regulator YafY